MKYQDFRQYKETFLSLLDKQVPFETVEQAVKKANVYSTTGSRLKLFDVFESDKLGCQ